MDSLATSGGETILLSGDFFGPLSLVRDEVASIKYGHHATAWDSNDRHYPPYFTHCEVILAHTLMQCISVEGTGKNLSLALEVDEQHSHIEPNARRESVGYGQPIVFDISTVHSVSLAEADTRGTDVATTRVSSSAAAAKGVGATGMAGRPVEGATTCVRVEPNPTLGAQDGVNLATNSPLRSCQKCKKRRGACLLPGVCMCARVRDCMVCACVYVCVCVCV